MTSRTKTIGPSCLAFAACCLTATIAAAHPFHISIAQVELNEKSGNLEVALRVNAVDLELVARRESKRDELRLEDKQRVEPVVKKYVGERILAHLPGRSEPVELEWVGMELEERRAWLYFEIPIGGKLAGVELENQLFFDILPDQVNTMNLRDASAKTTIHFTRQKAKRPIKLDRKRLVSPPKEATTEAGAR
ncbi:MAG: hypothetical protein QF805_23615 [Pirellulaceae bacterium]|nr:hypothetical protein [Pirellulaceae bacterium]